MIKVFIDGKEYGMLEGATVQHILDLFKPANSNIQFPAADEIKVNGKLATPDTPLHDGDEVTTFTMVPND